MPNSNKKTLFIFLLIVVILGLFIYGYQKYKRALSDKEALLILDYGNGKQRWFKGEVIEGMTVLNAIETSSKAGNFTYSATAQINQIDNLANNENQQWRCYLNNKGYLNNKEIQEDLNKTTIKPKDKILCRYGK